jgi:Endonuclease/Exonuclease/phosphatase family
MDDDNVLNLESIINNPEYDFLEKIRIFDDSLNNDNFINCNDSPYGECTVKCNYLDETQFYDAYSNNNRIMVMTWNVQSLPAKFEEFKDLITHMCLKNCSPDVICLQETWKVIDPELFIIDGYQCPVFKLRESSQGGGVAIYVKIGLNFNVVNKYSFSIDKVAESLFIELQTKDRKKYFFGSIYRTNAKYTSLAEKVQYEIFYDMLFNILSDINDTKTPAYVAGDFNIDVLKYTTNDFVNEYVDGIFINGFIQILSKPTRCTSHSATLIDHVITNDVRSNYESCILISKISDHFPVISFCDSVRSAAPQFIETRFLTQNNIHNFKENLANLRWNEVLNCNDTQTAYDIFHETFLDLYNLYFPVKKVKLNRNLHKIEPWFTNGLLTSRRRKNYLAKCAVQNPTIANKTIYNQCARLGYSES